MYDATGLLLTDPHTHVHVCMLHAHKGPIQHRFIVRSPLLLLLLQSVELRQPIGARAIKSAAVEGCLRLQVSPRMDPGRVDPAGKHLNKIPRLSDLYRSMAVTCYYRV